MFTTIRLQYNLFINAYDVVIFNQCENDELSFLSRRNEYFTSPALLEICGKALSIHNY